jgi:hypothetical protein
MKNTRKALEILSKGAKNSADIADRIPHRAEYVAQYDARDAAILERKNSERADLQLLTTLRKKVAKLSSDDAGRMPVITRFDLVNGMKSLGSTDHGVRSFVAHIEKMWHADPLGAFTYSALSEVVGHYNDQFPRSKIASLVNGQCVKSGLHKLPVAKLSRLAKKINTQEDFDSIVEINGFAGDRPEQIRARTMLRELAANRLEAIEQKPSDDLGQRVSDRVASLEKDAGLDEGNFALGESVRLAEQIASLLDEAHMEFLSESLDGAAGAAEAAQKNAASLLEMLRAAQSAGQPMSEDEVGQQVDMATPASDEPGAGPDLDDKSGPLSDEDMDLIGAGMKPVPGSLRDTLGKSKLNPKNWFKSKAGALGTKLNTIAGAAKHIKGGDKLMSVVAKLAKVAQLSLPEDELLAGPDLSSEPGDMPGLAPDADHDEDLGLAADPMPAAPVDESAVLDATQVMDEIQDAAADIVQAAPPAAQDYVQHERSEGHAHEVGTPGWGAEEKMEPAHADSESVPPDDAWLAEELAELESPAPLADGGAELGPPMPMAASLNDRIEGALLDGKSVKYASVSLRINDNDEVELWDGTSGRACDINNIRVAIADFKLLAREAKLAKDDLVLRAAFTTTDLVDIPCDQCASVKTYIKTARGLTCSCGNVLSDDLIKLASQVGDKITTVFNVKFAPSHASRVFDIFDRSEAAITVSNHKKSSAAFSLRANADDVADLWDGLIEAGAVAAASTKKLAQMDPSDPPTAPTLPGAIGIGVSTMPTSEPEMGQEMDHNISLPEVLDATFTTELAKQEGERLSTADIIKKFMTSFKGKLDKEWKEQFPTALAQVLGKFFSSSAAIPLTAQKLPELRKPSDAVKVEKGLGENSDDKKDIFKSPAVQKNPNKPGGKLSDKNLGKDSGDGEGFKSPAVQKNPNKPGGKLTNKSLGKDSGDGEGFKSPELKKPHSARKASPPDDMPEAAPVDIADASPGFSENDMPQLAKEVSQMLSVSKMPLEQVKQHLTEMGLEGQMIERLLAPHMPGQAKLQVAPGFEKSKMLQAKKAKNDKGASVTEFSPEDFGATGKEEKLQTVPHSVGKHNYGNKLKAPIKGPNVLGENLIKERHDQEGPPEHAKKLQAKDKKATDLGNGPAGRNVYPPERGSAGDDIDGTGKI